VQNTFDIKKQRDCISVEETDYYNITLLAFAVK